MPRTPQLWVRPLSRARAVDDTVTFREAVVSGNAPPALARGNRRRRAADGEAGAGEGVMGATESSSVATSWLGVVLLGVELEVFEYACICEKVDTAMCNKFEAACDALDMSPSSSAPGNVGGSSWMAMMVGGSCRGS